MGKSVKKNFKMELFCFISDDLQLNENLKVMLAL